MAPRHEASGVDHSRDRAVVIQACEAPRDPSSLRHGLTWRSRPRQWRINGVFSFSTCSMSALRKQMEVPLN
jgi:hypothetical protein